MHGDFLLLVLLMVFGCAAFFFGVIYLFCRLFGWVGRGMLSAVRPGAPENRAGTTQERVCLRSGCRRVEYRPEARYCSQCGAPFTQSPAGHESLDRLI